MKTMLQKRVYPPISNLVSLTFIISECSGINSYIFGCSNYTFHDNSTSTPLNWETSLKLCNKSDSSLVTIEEYTEWQFLENILQKRNVPKYFIGLKQTKGKWRWISNGKCVNETGRGDFPWASSEPKGDGKCATMYKNYRRNYGRFDDLGCYDTQKDAGYICERATDCKNKKGGSVTPQNKDSTRPSRTQTLSATPTTKSAMTKPQRQGSSSKKEDKTLISSTVTSLRQVTKYPEKAARNSHLVTIAVSVSAIVILAISITLWLVFVYRPRKQGSKSKIQQYQRRSNSTQLRRHVGLSLAEQEMDDYESLPEVKRQDACVIVEEGHRGSFLVMPQASPKRHEDLLVKEQSSTDGYYDPLNMSATTKTSKAFLENPEQHHVYAIVHINPKQDEAAFHLDPVIQDVGECPSQLIVDDEKSKPCVGTSSVGLEKELTRNEETIVKENASGRDQPSNDCVYAIVDKTKKKRQPPKKPPPYHDHLYADLSYSPKKNDNGRIPQERIATVYADIDHINMTDSRLQQENEVKLT